MLQQYTTLDGIELSNTLLTIGSFDGVHIGHQKLIRDLIDQARRAGGKSVVLTFHPHPAEVLRGRSGPFYLTTPAEKAEYLAELGIDILVTHPFTKEISQTPARDFVRYLHAALGFRQLWVGHDFALGRGREGNAAYLKQLGDELGYRLHEIDPVMNDGQPVSSSQIRKYLLAGDVTTAGRLLGRLYCVEGPVVHGDGRGKSIGIPTANLETSPEKLIPAAGVYACKAMVSGRAWAAAVNIGTRPTFESSDVRSHVEAHILDYSSDLYTQSIVLEFISRLRGEERFPSVADLIRQIHMDIEQTRLIFPREVN